MRKIKLTREERIEAAKWVADTSWVEKKKYDTDLEYLACVEDILNDKVFQSMEHFIQHGDTTCKAHCIQVSYLGYCICKKWGWDYRLAARGGLLHDLFLYDWHTHARETGNHFHGYTHPRVAMNNAVRYYQITEAEQNVILRHMWPLTPIPPKSMAGMAVLYADKFCSLTEIVSRAKKWLAYNIGSKNIA